MKYLLMGTSSNFGNMFSMAVASLFLPFLPMLPTQILLNNFLYDLAQVTIPRADLQAGVPRLLSFLPVRWQFEEGWSSARRSARDRDDAVPWEARSGEIIFSKGPRAGWVVGRDEVDHVRADLAVLGPAEAGRHEEDLFRHQR